jgi:hypothetical protein
VTKYGTMVMAPKLCSIHHINFRRDRNKHAKCVGKRKLCSLPVLIAVICTTKILRKARLVTNISVNKYWYVCAMQCLVRDKFAMPIYLPICPSLYSIFGPKQYSTKQTASPTHQIRISVICLSVPWNSETWEDGPPLWSSGQSSWLQIQRSRVWFSALPCLLRSSRSGSYLNGKVAAPGLENRD